MKNGVVALVENMVIEVIPVNQPQMVGISLQGNLILTIKVMVGGITVMSD